MAKTTKDIFRDRTAMEAVEVSVNILDGRGHSRSLLLDLCQIPEGHEWKKIARGLLARAQLKFC